MSLWGTLLELAFPLVLKAAKEIADSKISGEELSKREKETVWSAYCLINTNFQSIVESSDNTYDDAALAELAAFCEDTLLEAGIPIPVIPDFE